MSATIRERVALPEGVTTPRIADGVACMSRGTREEHWRRAMAQARALSSARGARVLAIITPGMTRGITWLDMYVERQP